MIFTIGAAYPWYVSQLKNHFEAEYIAKYFHVSFTFLGLIILSLFSLPSLRLILFTELLSRAWREEEGLSQLNSKSDENVDDQPRL